jgi:septal ring factor EnvC (AmiA/AmiB activator)
MDRAIDTDHFRSTAAASRGTGKSGGSVDDILRRLGLLESLVADVRIDVGAIKALLSQLATKAELESVRTDVESVRTDVESVRTEVQSVRTDVQSIRAEIAGVRGEMGTLEASLIKWMIGTVIAATTLAFSIAKFIN